MIYKHIDLDRDSGGYLYKLLRNHGKKSKDIGDVSKTKIPNRVGIELRPHIADECMEYGHFEGDSIVSKDHNGITITLTEKRLCNSLLS